MPYLQIGFYHTQQGFNHTSTTSYNLGDSDKLGKGANANVPSAGVCSCVRLKTFATIAATRRRPSVYSGGTILAHTNGIHHIHCSPNPGLTRLFTAMGLVLTPSDDNSVASAMSTSGNFWRFRLRRETDIFSTRIIFSP